ENLTNHKDDAYMSKELVTIKRDAPLEVSAETAAYEGYEPKKVRAIFMDLGFKSLVGRLQGDMEEDTASEMPPIEYTVIKEPKADMFTGHDALVIEMLEDNYHDARIEGIGVVNDKQASFIPAQTAMASAVFKRWAEDSEQKKVVFDAKQTRVALLNHGIHIKGIVFDMLMASYLLNPSENHHDVPAIDSRMGHGDVRLDEEVYGKGAKLQLPDQSVLSEHVVRKTHALHTLKKTMEEKLQANEQYALL